ncbi:hypothetical protein ACMZOO_11010 [Catenovulum sp. SX2]|uniref:hypothetical protein n=1 Tax=Catenovulum sp. SX2 TaxID=3398614 RepID=UPI003F8317AA
MKYLLICLLLMVNICFAEPSIKAELSLLQRSGDALKLLVKYSNTSEQNVQLWKRYLFPHGALAFDVLDVYEQQESGRLIEIPYRGIQFKLAHHTGDDDYIILKPSASVEAVVSVTPLEFNTAASRHHIIIYRGINPKSDSGQPELLIISPPLVANL